MKPILFNTETVRAILEGRKTMTRRVVKLPHCGYFEHDPPLGVVPPYRPGDILYVRETWAKLECSECSENADDCESSVERNGLTIFCDGEMYVYKATDLVPNGYRWRPSIHMPREAARIFLRVMDVRVERLQDIDNAGALAEGCDGRCEAPQDGALSDCQKAYDFSVERFSTVWDSTIKPADRDLYGWAANPWVWVISFERISRDEVEV